MARKPSGFQSGESDTCRFFFHWDSPDDLLRVAIRHATTIPVTGTQVISDCPGGHCQGGHVRLEFGQGKPHLYYLATMDAALRFRRELVQAVSVLRSETAPENVLQPPERALS